MGKFAKLAAALLVLASMGVFATEGSCECRSYCDLEFSVSNPEWGVAPTCDEAYYAAIGSAQNWARNLCASYGVYVCEFGNVSVVTSCMDKDGMKRVDVSIEYKCGYEQCDPDDPIEPPQN